MFDGQAARLGARETASARAAGQAERSFPIPTAVSNGRAAPRAAGRAPGAAVDAPPAAPPLFEEKSMTLKPPLAALALALALAAGAVAPALADDETQVQITLKDHKFDPEAPTAPAGKPIVIHLTNQDPTPAEFESKELRVEKVVPGGGAITVRVRALKPGRYRFFDDYHEASTQGFLVAQ